jgi:RCC1-like G exchanging factor-like protein
LFGCGINTDSQLGYHAVNRADENTLKLVIYPIPITLPELGCQIVKCAAGRAHLLVVSDQGVVYSLGNNSYGQCGRPIIEAEKYEGNSVIYKVQVENVKDVVCGQDHSLFINNSGQVYACGWGSDGQTGLGHYDMVSELSLVGGDIKGENIVKISCAADCVLALNGKQKQYQAH